MKVQFSKSQKYTPDWNGNTSLPEEERITCVLGILDMHALMGLLDSFTEVGLTGEVDTEKVETSLIKPVLAEFGTLLPKHVTEFEGLFNEAGAAVTIDDLVTYPIFLNLALELLMKLSEISSPNEDDVKNLKEPSASEQVPPVDGSQQN